jgi:hypothetical protein
MHPNGTLKLRRPGFLPLNTHTFAVVARQFEEAVEDQPRAHAVAD